MARTTAIHSALRGLCGLVVGLSGSCVRPATAIVVIVDTDLEESHRVEAPRAYRLTLSGRVREEPDRPVSELSAGDSLPVRLSWPASFTLVPREGSRVESPVRVDLALTLEPTQGGTASVIHRAVRVRFTQHQTTTIRVVLSVGCMQPSADCANPEGPCTVERACAEREMSCSLAGECVAIDQPTTAFDRDAAVARVDAATSPDAPDVSEEPPPCLPQCAGRSCGNDGCGGLCGTCPDRTESEAQCSASGQCNYTCRAGNADCDGLPNNGCEQPLGSVSHCRACSESCSGATLQCDPTRGCVSGCADGLSLCSGSCVNLLTNPNHCGACSRRPSEVCNRADDNCNGLIDEGIAPGLQTTSYGALGNGCTSATRSALQCATAAHRLCRSGPCATGGWGVAATSSSAPQVQCVVGEVMDVSWADLAAIDSDCDGSAGAGQHHESCLFAAHRYCARRAGMIGGFGTVEANSVPGRGRIVCVPTARGVVLTGISFSTLTALASGCSTLSRFNGDCFAAINEHCRRTVTGSVGGVGPVAVNLISRRADVLCLR
ncbi:MAG: hypothetical protein Q8Q09_04500 [Deltaproteobacteria bacterium]|nr:hypothetical protein [Deltaproteobacteria bacterium]